MAIRTDFTIDWTASPRIIIVDAPAVEVTMQDLLDTLRDEESSVANISYPPIVAASGKEPLGGGTLVGLTVSLQNAVFGFEARPGPDWVVCNLSGGNLVSFDTDGVTTINPTYPTAFVSRDRTSSASATLQEQDALNYASYGNMVSVDPLSLITGTVYPAGNQEYPVNNLTDAVAIAAEKGFTTFGIRNSLTTAGEDISDMAMIGRSHINVVLTLETLADTSGLKISNFTIEGVMDGGNGIWDCIVHDIDYFNGHIHRSALAGTITLGGGSNSYLSDCSRELTSVQPIIDFNDTAEKLVMDSYNGSFEINNMTHASAVAMIGLARGQVVLNSVNCTAGSLNCMGIGLLVDENGTIIESGTWNGMTIINQLLNASTVQDANVVQVNSIEIDGVGTELNPWGPV